jgi:hypothetical protein
MAITATTFDDLEESIAACATHGDREQLCDLLVGLVMTCGQVNAMTMDGHDPSSDMDRCASLRDQILNEVL